VKAKWIVAAPFIVSVISFSLALALLPTDSLVHFRRVLLGISLWSFWLAIMFAVAAVIIWLAGGGYRLALNHIRHNSN
jgi:hypothetical protein